MSYSRSSTFEEIRSKIQSDIDRNYSYNPNYLYEIDNAFRMSKISRFEADLLYDLLAKLRRMNENIENEIALNSMKNQKIKTAKQRYNEHNALWKFFHKKLNPSKLDLNNMSVEEIADLTHTIMYGENNGKTR